MKQILSKWCTEVSIFTITILVLQVTGDAIAGANPLVAVLLGITATALLLAAGIALAESDKADDGKRSAGRSRGRSIAVRTGARNARAKNARKASGAATKGRLHGGR